MKKLELLLAGSVFSILATGNALAADDKGPYIGIGVGFTSIDAGTSGQELANELVALGFSSATVTIDESSTGFKLLGGYRVNKNFAVEGYYANLGTYDFTVFTTGPVATVTGEVEVTALGMDLLGIVPFNPTLSGFARVGVYRWDSEGTVSGPGGTFSASEDGTDFKFGLGLDWKVAEAMSVRAEWEYYNNDDSISMLSAGIVFRF